MNPTMINPLQKSFTKDVENFPPLGFNKPDIQLAAATIQFRGPTGAVGGPSGIVGTAFGLPGIGATRVYTGLYRVQVPKAEKFHVFLEPAVPTGVGTLAPTGLPLSFAVANKNYASGTFELHYLSGSNANRQNPPHNTELSLLFWVENLVQY